MPCDGPNVISLCHVASMHHLRRTRMQCYHSSQESTNSTLQHACTQLSNHTIPLSNTSYTDKIKYTSPDTHYVKRNIIALHAIRKQSWSPYDYEQNKGLSESPSFSVLPVTINPYTIVREHEDYYNV